jgi:hypothetical protein
MSSPVVSASDHLSLWSLEYALPALAIVALAINLGKDPKYADLRSMLGTMISEPLRALPEILGFLAVGLAVVLCLVLHPSGIYASTKDLAVLKHKDQYLFETRRMWPNLLHPDTLLTAQQLLQALGALLLVIRGACTRGNALLALSLLLSTAGQSVRFNQWADQEDYIPEGPLGGFFGACCAGICFATTLWASTVAARSAIRGAGPVGVLNGVFAFALLLGFSVWTASTHYLTVSGNHMANVAFSFAEAADLCSAVLLAIAACSMAAQQVPKMDGTLAALSLGQALSLFWFMDFLGLLWDPGSSEPFVKLDLEVKRQLRTMVHGHAFEFLAVSQAVQLVGTFVAFGGYAVIRFSNPPTSTNGSLQSLVEVEPINV